MRYSDQRIHIDKYREKSEYFKTKESYEFLRHKYYLDQMYQEYSTLNSDQIDAIRYALYLPSLTIPTKKVNDILPDELFRLD